MNNILSYCGLVAARINVYDKDLSVLLITFRVFTKILLVGEIEFSVDLFFAFKLNDRKILRFLYSHLFEMGILL